MIYLYLVLQLGLKRSEMFLEKKDHSLNLLKDFLGAYDLDISEETLTQVLKFGDLIYKENEDINLTAIREYKDALVLNIADSLSYQIVISKIIKNLIETKQAVGENKKINYVDIGCGGGFPLFPIGITNDFTTFGIESVKKKAQILSKVNKEMGLDITIIDLRCEEACLLPDLYKSFDLLTARAMDSLPSLLEYAAPLLRSGSYALFSKGPDCDDEIKRADKLSDVLGLKLCDSFDLNLPHGYGSRKLLLYFKEHEETIELPRRVGKAHKSPLA